MKAISKYSFWYFFALLTGATGSDSQENTRRWKIEVIIYFFKVTRATSMLCGCGGGGGWRGGIVKPALFQILTYVINVTLRCFLYILPDKKTCTVGHANNFKMLTVFEIAKHFLGLPLFNFFD